MTFILGHRVRDKLSGFTGIAHARVEYLHGCVQIGIIPPVDNEGKLPDAQYIDEARLEYVDDGVHGTVEAKPTGGPGRASEQPPR